VYVSAECPNCGEAVRLAQESAARYPDIVVRVIDLDELQGPPPDPVVAVPTYVLDGQVVFRDLPRSEVERLAETTRMITCARGKVVYRAGESNEVLFLLKTGRVQIVRESADGKRLISAVLGAHTFFGEMALVGQRLPQESTAEAIEEALICVLSRKDLERLILQHPKVGLRFLEQLSARLLETEAIVEDFAFTSVPARLAGALLRLVETSPDKTAHVSHQELADMIGAYRETVTVALDELQTRSVVRLGRRSIEVVDRTRLETIAAG
jgi:CRP/FNR family transcriptional regulator, cyclic AMP receptor protein